MSINDSCIVYSEKGLELARNGELERLLDQLVDRLATDHRWAEAHSGQNVLDCLGEEIVCRLQHLERVIVRLAVAPHDELRLNFTRYARALQYRRIFRLRTV